MRNRLRILETKKPRWWQLSERNHAKFCHKQLVVPRVSVHPRILRNNHNNKNRQWRPCYRHPHHLMQSARRPSHERIWFGGNNPGQPGLEWFSGNFLISNCICASLIVPAVVAPFGIGRSMKFETTAKERKGMAS